MFRISCCLFNTFSHDSLTNCVRNEFWLLGLQTSLLKVIGPTVNFFCYIYKHPCIWTFGFLSVYNCKTWYIRYLFGLFIVFRSWVSFAYPKLLSSCYSEVFYDPYFYSWLKFSIIQHHFVKLEKSIFVWLWILKCGSNCYRTFTVF